MQNRESPITPTVGRIVLVRGTSIMPEEPYREVPAIVTRVWGQNCINVQVMKDSWGDCFLTSVEYVEDVEQIGLNSAWRWMPYQVQAAADRAKPEKPWLDGDDRRNGVG